MVLLICIPEGAMRYSDNIRKDCCDKYRNLITGLHSEFHSLGVYVPGALERARRSDETFSFCLFPFIFCLLLQSL